MHSAIFGGFNLSFSAHSPIHQIKTLAKFATVWYHTPIFVIMIALLLTKQRGLHTLIKILAEFY